MSRIGNAPIAIPDGVDISIAGRDVTVKGSKGELSMTLPGEITASIEDGTFTAVRPDDSGENKAMHGLARTLVANMVTGVSEGFTKKLEIVGVGYRAAAKGSNALEMQLGFSHPVHIQAPEGIEFEVADIGNGRSTISAGIPMALTDTYGQWNELDHNTHGPAHVR